MRLIQALAFVMLFFFGVSWVLQENPSISRAFGAFGRKPKAPSRTYTKRTVIHFNSPRIRKRKHRIIRMNKGIDLYIKLISMRAKQKFERDKLRLSIQTKFRRLERCYAWTLKKKKRRSKTKKKISQHKVDVTLRLSPLGRALSTQIQSSTMSKAQKDCFIWYFRGRKFFPPEGNRAGQVKLHLQVVLGQARPAKKSKKRRRTR